MRQARRRRSVGLTLIEMLVVLVIVAMIAAVMLQGIAQGFALFSRLDSDQDKGYRSLVSEQWLRQSVAATTLAKRGADALSGTSERVEFTTLRALLASEGLPVRASLGIGEDGTLLYEEETQQFALALRALRIAYQDRDGAWSDHWQSAEQGALPARVRFMLTEEELLDIALDSGSVSAADEEEELFDED